MNVSYTRSVSALALAALLAGCAGAASGVNPIAGASTGYANATVNGIPISKLKHSWMARGAASTALLYVDTNQEGSGYVFVYSYPTGKLEGWLVGFNFDSPQNSPTTGLCADKSGNVFIPNAGTAQIFEYSHGGTTPIATLNEPAGYAPTDCSRDPKTGNLAVTNMSTGGHSEAPGNVAIFQNARGTSTTYTNSGFFWYKFCSYDNQGNLFLDATNQNISNPGFEFAELAKGGNTLNVIKLNQAFSSEGGVRWDGKHITVVDASPSVPPETVYAFSLSGSSGTVVGSTPLTPISSGVYDYWIQGTKLVLPFNSGWTVQLYSYPAGGNPTKTILQQAFAATVSV